MGRLVKESIDFKRGISSKEALNIGKLNDPNLKGFHEEALNRGYKDITPSDYPKEDKDTEVIRISAYNKNRIYLNVYAGTEIEDSEYKKYYINTAIGNFYVDEPIGEWITSDYWWDHVETLEREEYEDL